MRLFLSRAALPLVLALTATGASAAGPPNGGSISIEPPEGSTAPLPRPFVEAATEALATHGFTIIEDPGHSAYIAELVLTRTDVGTGSARIPAGKPGAITGTTYGGVGGGVAIPLAPGGDALVPLRRTRLEVRIRKRGEPGAVWDGAAVTIRAAGTRQGADGVVATDLSNAVLRPYPAEPPGLVGVP